MKLITISASLLLAAGQVAAQDGPVLRRTDADDQIIQVQTKVRHTTVIVLPAPRRTFLISWWAIPSTGT